MPTISNVKTQCDTVLKSNTDEARQYNRYALPMPIVVQSITSDPTMPGWSQTAVLCDISLQGLSFTSARAYAIDSEIEIRIVLGVVEYIVGALVLRANVKQQVHEADVQFLNGNNISVFIPALAKYLCHRFHQEPTDVRVSPRIAAYKNRK